MGVQQPNGIIHPILRLSLVINYVSLPFACQLDSKIVFSFSSIFYQYFLNAFVNLYSLFRYGGLHYDLHNLYGLTETIATNFAVKQIRGKRPFIISRSTFPGQGHYGGHWSGDVVSDWTNLRRSITSILNYNMYVKKFFIPFSVHRLIFQIFLGLVFLWLEQTSVDSTVILQPLFAKDGWNWEPFIHSLVIITRTMGSIKIQLL
jgi:hypothetical protein